MHAQLDLSFPKLQAKTFIDHADECFLEVSMYVELKKLLKHCTRNEREIFGHDNVIKKFIQ